MSEPTCAGCGHIHSLPRVCYAAVEWSKTRTVTKRCGCILSANHTPSPSADRPPGEPTTPTGKRLMASDFDTTGWGPRVVREYVAEAVPAIEQEAAAAERRRLLEVHMADHDDATGWCPTCALLTEDE